MTKFEICGRLSCFGCRRHENACGGCGAESNSRSRINPQTLLLVNL
ncbi:MAG: hypothetical protein F6K40_34750 [Okeania sp. SIO3I5]|nr:hypothetical protein [Okeania sp. SIO3I5]NEQ41095.1 hypothetical protein [Okeania sp. SIO3I5]